MDPDKALIYLDFVAERHRIWEKRQQGLPQPWTDDPQMRARKFTNVFRVLDYGSQYVLTDLVDPELSVRDQLARLFLYRHTGRVETWRYLLAELGEYPTVDNLPTVLEAWKDYRGQVTVHSKGKRKTPGRGNGFQKQIGERPIFTGAYLVFPQSHERGTDKLESIVDLTYRLFHPDSPTELVTDFEQADTQAGRFATLRRNRGVADFMSMQVLTDFGYTPQCGRDVEDEFCVLGPGAVRGAKAIAPSWPVQRTFEWAIDATRSLDDSPQLRTASGYRQLSWMDVQNTLCEFSKLVRYLSAPPREYTYKPAHPGRQQEPVLPEHW